MILVDTSVWIDYLRQGDDQLAALLEQRQVLMSELTIGELACGSLKNRASVLELLSALPRANPVTMEEGIAFINAHQLMSRGIGFVDVLLLATASLNQVLFWTSDKRLAVVASELGLGYCSAPTLH